MATIIRAADAPASLQGAAFNFDDLAVQGEEHLTRVRAEAARLIAEAQEQADAIRQRAAEEGCQAALQAVEQMVAEQSAPAIAALRQVAGELRKAGQTWTAQWERNAVHLATAIAARVIRREVVQHPEITLTLVHEALELAAGSPGIRLRLNPQDKEALGQQVRALVDAVSTLGSAEIIADGAIARGGCRLETRFGAIDQQIETQLRRIEEELTQ